MLKRKNLIFLFLTLFFLGFSFYPTVFEIIKGQNLADKNREFILEHNYYWPDFNLYLSKVRQGQEGNLLPKEKYTTEVHRGSLIQSFYAFLGFSGGFLGLSPNYSYQMGRIIISPLLVFIIIKFCLVLFKKHYLQLIAFVITLSAGSFPRLYKDHLGNLNIGRYMEWWSNIDAVQKITFIPHILFGQFASFLILLVLAINKHKISKSVLLLLIILGNLAGLVFPPSLITLNAVLTMLSIFIFIKNFIFSKDTTFLQIIENKEISQKMIFILFTMPSLIYTLVMTRFIPWSGLVDYHRNHPMLIPFWDYFLGTGPVFFLGILGGIIAFIRKRKDFIILFLWLITTLIFAVLFTLIKEQSPLRFTQTGLFIPLGLLSAYVFQSAFDLSKVFIKRKNARLAATSAIFLIILLFITSNIYLMGVSLKWQTTFIKQRIGASVPLVPYPPQTMYPLKDWMDAIRWLKDNTLREDNLLAGPTAANFIPAYSGNTVYWGQSNTVNYDYKESVVRDFLSGKYSVEKAAALIRGSTIKYIFESYQEREIAGGKTLDEFYPFLKSVYQNPSVIIYKPQFD